MQEIQFYPEKGTSLKIPNRKDNKKNR